jgi:hypothetical protein
MLHKFKEDGRVNVGGSLACRSSVMLRYTAMFYTHSLPTTVLTFPVDNMLWNALLATS